MSHKVPLTRQLGAVNASLTLAFVLAAGLLTAPAAHAFQEDPVAAAGSGQLPAEGAVVAAREPGGETDGFSADQLSAFAEAVRAVQTVDRAWSGRIDWADTAEQAEDFTGRAAEEMAAAIEAEGLSVREYNAITQAVAEDQHLHDLVTGLLAGKGYLKTAEVPADDRRPFYSEQTPPSSGLTILTSGL